MKDKNKLIKQIRQALADYIYSEGCSCCRDEDAHRTSGELLAKLLNVPKYSDGSGYDFYKFRSEKT